MAGGNATRMGKSVEKPMLEINNKRLIDIVLGKLSEMDEIEGIYVATSKNTPLTEHHITSNYPQIKVIETSGACFHEDLVEAIGIGELYFPLLVLPSDLPLIDTEFLSEVVSIYNNMDYDSLSVFLRVEKDSSYGPFSFYMEGENVIPSGINIIDGSCIGLKNIPQFNLIEDYQPRFLNINTKEDLELAKKIYNLKEGP